MSHHFLSAIFILLFFIALFSTVLEMAEEAKTEHGRFFGHAWCIVIFLLGCNVMFFFTTTK